MAFARQVDSADPRLIADVARRALGSDAAEPVAWECVPISYVANPMAAIASRGIYRVGGTARDRGRTAPWSAILKEMHSPVGFILPDGMAVTEEMAADQGNFGYWKRELLAYRSGLLDDLPGGIAAPRCLGITEQPDDSHWLWLEDVEDTGGEWPMETYGTVARQLGAFNGAYLAGEPLPDYPWLSRCRVRGWIEGPVTSMMGAVQAQPHLWQHPALRASLPRDIPGRLMRLWAGRDTLLDALDRLPRVYCHLDAFRGNLLLRPGHDGERQTVAVDWAFTGIAAVGEEVGPLVVATLLNSHLPTDQAAELESVALDGYLQGLTDAGWGGDPALARLGYSASVALRYGVQTTVELALLPANEGMLTATEHAHGCTYEQFIERRVPLIRTLLDRADEALALAG